MKCFECGRNCITQYWNGDKLTTTMHITHVNKACINCNWQSFKTKIPDKLV